MFELLVRLRLFLSRSEFSCVEISYRLPNFLCFGHHELHLRTTRIAKMAGAERQGRVSRLSQLKFMDLIFISEALNVLGALNNLPAEDPDVWGEFQAIKDSVLENQKRGGLKDLVGNLVLIQRIPLTKKQFTMGPDRHLHRTMLAYVNQMFQQISGINLITYYAATIYQNEIGLEPLTSRILAAANGTGKIQRSTLLFWFMLMHLPRIFPSFVDCGIHH